MTCLDHGYKNDDEILGVTNKQAILLDQSYIIDDAAMFQLFFTDRIYTLLKISWRKIQAHSIFCLFSVTKMYDRVKTQTFYTSGLREYSWKCRDRR